MYGELKDDRLDQDDSEQADGACVLQFDYAEDVVKLIPQTSLEPDSIPTACSLCVPVVNVRVSWHLCACIRMYIKRNRSLKYHSFEKNSQEIVGIPTWRMRGSHSPWGWQILWCPSPSPPPFHWPSPALPASAISIASGGECIFASFFEPEQQELQNWVLLWGYRDKHMNYLLPWQRMKYLLGLEMRIPVTESTVTSYKQILCLVAFWSLNNVLPLSRNFEKLTRKRNLSGQWRWFPCTRTSNLIFTWPGDCSGMIWLWYHFISDSTWPSPSLRISLSSS